MAQAQGKGEPIYIGKQIAGYTGDPGAFASAVRGAAPGVSPGGGDENKWDVIGAFARGGDATDEGDEADDEEEDEGDEEEDEPEPGQAPGSGGKGDEDQGTEAEPSRFRRILGAGKDAVNSVIPHELVQRVSRAPTPGGLFPLIFLLIFLLLAIVPMGPHNTTRLELIWRALTGGAALPDTQAKQTKEQAIEEGIIEGAALSIDPTLAQDILAGMWGLI